MSILFAPDPALPLSSRDGANNMHATNVQPFSVLDALGIIAACSNDPKLFEMVSSLQAITTGELRLAPGPHAEVMARRMGQRLRNPQWAATARSLLLDATSQYLTYHLFQWCVRCAPTNASNPLTDETWLPRVRMLYSWDPHLQLLADTLVNQFRVLDDYDDAAQAPAVAAPAIAPAEVAPAVAAPAPTQETNFALLMRRLHLATKAKRFVDQFVRHWNEQKARAAMAQSVAEANSSRVVPAVAPIPNTSMAAPEAEPRHIESPQENPPASTHESRRFANKRTRRPSPAVSLHTANLNLQNLTPPNPLVGMQPHSDGLSPPM